MIFELPVWSGNVKRVKESCFGSLCIGVDFVRPPAPCLEPKSSPPYLCICIASRTTNKQERNAKNFVLERGLSFVGLGWRDSSLLRNWDRDGNGEGEGGKEKGLGMGSVGRWGAVGEGGGRGRGRERKGIWMDLGMGRWRMRVLGMGVRDGGLVVDE